MATIVSLLLDIINYDLKLRMSLKNYFFDKLSCIIKERQINVY